MNFQGHVERGVVIFDEPVSLPEGTEVRIEPVLGQVTEHPSEGVGVVKESCDVLHEDVLRSYCANDSAEPGPAPTRTSCLGPGPTARLSERLMRWGRSSGARTPANISAGAS